MLLGMTACAEKKNESSAKKKVPDVRMTVHTASSDPGKVVTMAEVLKQKTLPDFPAMPIGKAFDGYKYFKKKEWRETRVNGKYYIDFVGIVDSSIAEVTKTNITVQSFMFKFVIMEDGTFGLVMASKDESLKDGTIRSFVVNDVRILLEKIYGNQEIRF